MNVTGTDSVPTDPNQIQFSFKQTEIKSESGKYHPQDKKLILQVKQPDLSQSSDLSQALDLESGSKQTSQKVLFPYKEMAYNRYTGHKSVFTDQLADYRYQIPFNANLPERNDTLNFRILYWQNHEGTKSVVLEQKLFDNQTQTEFKFTLLDYRYRVLASEFFHFQTNIRVLDFQFSYDESYLAFKEFSNQYRFCYFQNGFENDLFDAKIGKSCLQKMLLTSFNIQGVENLQHNQSFRISSDNHFFLFFDLVHYWSYYISKMTVDQLINKFQSIDQNKKLLSINDDFEQLNDKPQSKQIIKIQQDQIIGFDHESLEFWTYNYEKRINSSYQNEVRQDKILCQQLFYTEMQHQRVFFIVLKNDKVRLFFFGRQYLYIFEYIPQYNFHGQRPFLYMRYDIFEYPQNSFLQRLPITRIEDNSITCQQHNSVKNDALQSINIHYFHEKYQKTLDQVKIYVQFDRIAQIYDIDFNLKKIVLKRQIANHFFYDLMKQSFILLSCDNDKKKNIILNYQGTSYANHISPIIMNRIYPWDQIIGKNCFNQFLSLGDLLFHIQQTFPYYQFEIFQYNELAFYSKNLNIFVKKGVIVFYLDNLDPIKIQNGKLKNLIIQEKEVLRIFDTESDTKKVTCYTFLENNKLMQSFYETEFESKFIISEDSDEIAIIRQDSLNILEISEQHEFKFHGQSDCKIIQDIKPDQKIRFLHRILIINEQIYRFSKCYSKTIASFQKINIDGIISTHQNYLIELQNKQARIFDIEDLQLRSLIEFDKEFDTNLLLVDYTRKQFDIQNLYFKVRDSCHMERLQLLNDDKIFGIYLKIIDKPSLISLIDLKKNILEYYPINANGTIDINNCLSCTVLKFYLDPLTEYQDIDNAEYKLAKRDNDIIKNINQPDSLLTDVIVFNALHDNFSLQLFQMPEAKRIIPAILKKLYLNADQQRLMPYLMFPDKNCSSPLNFAIKNKDVMLVNNFIDLCIKQDHQGLLYSDCISPLLQDMKNLGIDLKPLFQSIILFHQIDNENPNYPQYKPEYKYCITHSNAKSLFEILYKEKQKFETEENEANRVAFKIQYQIVNMKDYINNEETQDQQKYHKNRKVQQIIKLFDELSDKDLTYLDIELLQVIINFKWKTYTQRYFFYQFLLWLLFIASFIIDIASSNKIYGMSNLIGFQVTRTTCQTILLWFFYYEVRQLQKEEFDYFSSGWNICDFSIHLIFPSYIFVSFYCQSQLYAIKSLQSVIIVLAFIKFLFFLRIFKQFSFLIQMLVAVFRDLRTFLFFFGIVISFFSIFVGILVNDLSDYDGIGPAGYFMIALRESIGDYDTASYSKNTDYKIIGWIVYLIVMILGNVIFMNFIIAVVSQSYENCMQKSIAQSFKVKIDMIRERESIMTQEQYQNKDWFPNYIILCKPLSEGRNSDVGEIENEWNGLLKQMEKGVKRQFEVTNQQQKRFITEIKSDIKIFDEKLIKETEQTSQIILKIEEQKNEIKMMEQRMNNKMEYLSKEINDRMEEFKLILSKK